MDATQNSDSKLTNCFWHPPKFKRDFDAGRITTYYLYQVLKVNDDNEKPKIESTDFTFDEFKLYTEFKIDFGDCP